MSGLCTLSKGTGKAMLALLVVVVVGAGVPVIEVHAHDDAAFGHGHDVHVHSHDRSDMQDPDGTHGPSGTGEETQHAHITGSIAVAVTSSLDVEISIPCWGESYIPRPASRPPDKPVPPLYRPPIA